MRIHRKERWKGILPEEHLWHFTPRTLTGLIEKYGFTVMDVTTENHKYKGTNRARRVFYCLASGVAVQLELGESMVAFAAKSHR